MIFELNEKDQKHNVRELTIEELEMVSGGIGIPIDIASLIASVLSLLATVVGLILAFTILRPKPNKQSSGNRPRPPIVRVI